MRRTSNNVLLARDDVGRAKRSTRDLPEGDHTFGAKIKRDPVGVCERKLTAPYLPGVLTVCLHSDFAVGVARSDYWEFKNIRQRLHEAQQNRDAQQGGHLPAAELAALGYGRARAPEGPAREHHARQPEGAHPGESLAGVLREAEPGLHAGEGRGERLVWAAIGDDLDA